MIKNTSLSLLFYLRKDKPNSKGEFPIYMRITVDGQRVAIAANREISAAKWNNQAGRAKGNKEDIKSLNKHLDTMQGSVLAHQTDLLQRDKVITAETLKNAFLGKDTRRYSVIEAFEIHNAQIKEKEGTEFANATITRYDTTLQHIKNFMLAVYNRSDMFLSELDYKFITDLEHYFKTKKGKCNHNSTLKYIRNFRKVINIAVGNDWLDKDPFMNYKSKLEESKRTYLDAEELKAIEEKEITIERLAIVRDVFVFCCYTGLAYADVEKLTSNDIRTGIDGKKWIFTYRQKTDTKSNVPLLPTALAIIDKYATHEDCIYTGKLLPVKSNQKMNAYIKEVATICKVEKDLTTHMARHTFSTTVALTNDMPIETLSKILGHKNIRTTQIYGKVIDKKVGSDMADVQKKLEQKAG
jgi:integrase